MKITSILTAAALGFVLLIGAGADEASAQTQCAVGTLVGSASCGPETPQSGGAAPSGPPRIRERVSGIGGFAVNTDTGAVYSWTGHGYSAEDAVWQALEKCQQPNYARGLSMAPPPEADAKCEKMSYWQNSCAAVALGEIEGADHYFAKTGANPREARATTLSECQARGGNCTMVHDAVCVAGTTRTREVMMRGN